LSATRGIELHFAADSIIGLCLLLFTQLFLKVEPFKSVVLARKHSLTWSSYSRSF